MAEGRERRCIVSRATEHEARLIRFAVAPDGVVTPDLAAKLPGRGAWVRADRDSLATAVRTNAFARSARRPVTAAPDLPDQVERLLEARCLAQLGLARRAGELAVGFDQVRGLARGRRPAYLIEAADGAADGRSKVIALVRAIHGEVPIAGCFTRDALGEALGRAPVAHAALDEGAAARRFAVDVERLAGFRPIRPSAWADADG